MKNPETKAVAYAYPTSPSADKFGFKSGCYTVDIVDAHHMPRAVAAFATWEEACANADKINLPWNPLFLRMNQGACER